MEQPIQPAPETTISDEVMMKHISYCGVFVACVALAIAWIANSLA